MRNITAMLVPAILWACGDAATERGTGPQEPDAPVAAAADPWGAARARGIDFRGLGQEPGWILEIDSGTSIRLVYDYGQQEVTLPAPRPSAVAGTTIYDARTGDHHLRVVIEDQPCSDVMSGFGFPRTVTVTFDGSTYQGCGREL